MDPNAPRMQPVPVAPTAGPPPRRGRRPGPSVMHVARTQHATAQIPMEALLFSAAAVAKVLQKASTDVTNALGFLREARDTRIVHEFASLIRCDIDNLLAEPALHQIGARMEVPPANSLSELNMFDTPIDMALSVFHTIEDKIQWWSSSLISEGQVLPAFEFVLRLRCVVEFMVHLYGVMGSLLIDTGYTTSSNSGTQSSLDHNATVLASVFDNMSASGEHWCGASGSGGTSEEPDNISENISDVAAVPSERSDQNSQAGYTIHISNHDIGISTTTIVEIYSEKSHFWNPLPRVPSSPSGQICSVPALFDHRQKLLESLMHPSRLDSVYNTEVKPELDRMNDDSQTELFEIMHKSWMGYSKRDSCGSILDKIISRTSYASSQVLADIYCLWYSSDSAFRNPAEEQHLCACSSRLERALIAFATCSSMDRLVAAELMQITIDFLARIQTSDFADELTKGFVGLPLGAKKMGRPIKGLRAVRVVAEAFWYEAFNVFVSEGFYYDALAMTLSMLGICDAEDCTHYLEAIRETVPKINSKRIQRAFAHHLADIERRITAGTRISSEDMDLPRIFAAV